MEETEKIFDLFVFHRTLGKDQECIEAGARGIVVDLENYGKRKRQANFDTQINEHSVNDIQQLHCRGIYTICRVNGFNPDSEAEIEKVISAGADEILLPMVRCMNEVDIVYSLVNNRAGIGLMIETPEALELAASFDTYDLTRVFLGLNDLHIAQGRASIFHVLADDVVEKVRPQIKHASFGFGGLTLPGAGDPLNVEYFFHELARLDCQFTFLRRSYFRDGIGALASRSIPAIHKCMLEAKRRKPTQVIGDQKNDKKMLYRVIERMA